MLYICGMEITTLSKQELKTLIDQSELAMVDLLKSDMVKANKLNLFIGDLIDLYASK